MAMLAEVVELVIGVDTRPNPRLHAASTSPVTRVSSDSASSSGSTRGAGSGRSGLASTASAHSPTGHGDVRVMIADHAG
jgi:hypothetical protein